MTSGPIRDLDSLLVEMSPLLDPKVYVFTTSAIAVGFKADAALFVFHEAEGTTYVIERDLAEQLKIPYEFPCRRITLRVNSALESVGFLATMLRTLATSAIPTNCVSAFYHDHLFVPEHRADEALRALHQLSADTARRLLKH